MTCTSVFNFGSRVAHGSMNQTVRSPMGSKDIYGKDWRICYKLGEDLAEKEFILTESGYKRLYRIEWCQLSIIKPL